MMSPTELQEIHDFLVLIARRAADMILKANPSTVTADSKKNSADLVTETDHAVERMVHCSLKSKYPDFEFLGEETYVTGQKLSAKPTFICDPIDGTINFVHGLPTVCISLGFTLGHMPIIGVILNPFTAQLYSSIKNQGAFLNLTTRLPLKSVPAPLEGLNKALVAVEWGSDRAGANWDLKARTVLRLVSGKETGGCMVHSLRSQGSAALDFCAVAAGSLDLFWEGGCWAWDVAAGWAILEEAGGMVVDANPGGWSPRVDGRRYLCVRKGRSREEQKAMVEEMWAVMGDSRFTY
ncbi:MAG: hypothetical protein M1829_002980 [Trizodia sp. TS-e1964]|nr:MAG: hypothetical protein M1829_002980 [Trizodia sp. TS-e1964]